jgi:hypothetical protein
MLQEVLLWIKSVIEETGSDVTTDQLKEYVWKTLKSGKVAYLSVMSIDWARGFLPSTSPIIKLR